MARSLAEASELPRFPDAGQQVFHDNIDVRSRRISSKV